MINKLIIKNFKSIKDLKLECKRINIFIGEPNVGKSNILEALGFLSWSGYLDHNTQLRHFVRIRNPQDLYYDNLLDEPIKIVCKIKDQKFEVDITFNRESFKCNILSSNASLYEYVGLNYDGNTISRRKKNPLELSAIKFYRFRKQEDFPDKTSSYLLPPHGSNLFAIVMSHKKLKQIMSDFFKTFGYKLVLRPQERMFEFQKMEDDIVTSFPYVLSSDTLQRIIFYTIAMESNKSSTLVFEEPESHAFPFYTKYLGERIAFDESNQYFIATHNPYLITSIIEKAKIDQISVFATYLKEYQTNVKSITGKNLSSLLDSDPFFNISMFLEGEGK